MKKPYETHKQAENLKDVAENIAHQVPGTFRTEDGTVYKTGLDGKTIRVNHPRISPHLLPVKEVRDGDAKTQYFKCNSCGKIKSDWTNLETYDCFANVGLCIDCYSKDVKDDIPRITLMAEEEKKPEGYKPFSQIMEETQPKVPCIYLTAERNCSVVAGHPKAHCPCADYSEHDKFVELCRGRWKEDKEKRGNIMTTIVDGITKALNPDKQKANAREEKCVVIGAGGEVGTAIMNLLSSAGYPKYGIDKSFPEGAIIADHIPISKDDFQNCKFMHICIPYINQKQFVGAVIGYARNIQPEIIIIHSTVLPGTTRHIGKIMSKWAARSMLSYSPCRGQHISLIDDFKRYDKWMATEGPCRDDVEWHMKHLGMKVCGFSDRQWEHLELSKLIDTTQYGMLIMYAQVANRLAENYNINYEFVRDFMHQTNEFYNNRPDITPGYVGGKCVKQNIELLNRIHPHELWKIFRDSNNERAKELGLSPDEMNK